MARIAFFGTPAFAETQLAALLRIAAQQHHEVVVVVVQPDKKAGRGQKLVAPPTKTTALLHHIPVLQPTTLKKDTPDGEAFFAEFAALHVDLAIVAAYGRLIPQRVLDLPRLGMVNVHGSLLPRFRGAAPVQRAIEAGDRETGVCLMHMVKALDAGGVYAKQTLAIHDDDDSDTLMQRCAMVGAALLTEHLDDLLHERLKPVPQNEDGLVYAAQLTKDEGRVRFDRPANAVSAHARAMHPWPGASTSAKSQVLKLFQPRVVDAAAKRGVPGEILAVDGEAIVVQCGEGTVAFLGAQLPSKNRVAASTLVHGRVLQVGEVLGRDVVTTEAP